MKFFVALLSFIFSVVIADGVDHAEHSGYVVKTNVDLLRYREECVSQLNIPLDLVMQYQEWKYPNDEKTHCYLKCILEKFELYDAEKGFDVYRVHHQLEGDKADHTNAMHVAIDKCAKEAAVASDDACVRAYRGFTCFLMDYPHLIPAGNGSK
uniref:General odorant binding protein 99a-like protein n=1 Tax=Zeugodacus tau TaxID=137263 RepID=A0A1D6Y6H3_ZEUTA|nr:general odorant binding protein 99a-like protein [Zeugodacus tau]